MDLFSNRFTKVHLLAEITIKLPAEKNRFDHVRILKKSVPFFFAVLNRLVHKKAAYLEAGGNAMNPELYGDVSVPTGQWGDAESAFRLGPNFDDQSFRLTTKRTPM